MEEYIINDAQYEKLRKCYDELTEVTNNLKNKLLAYELNKTKLLYLIKVDNLELSVRTMRVFKRNNINYVGDILSNNQYFLRKLFPNFGKGSLKELKETLKIFGLDLEKGIKNWPVQFNIDAIYKINEDKIERLRKETYDNYYDSYCREEHI
jgi:DNA-directed RNA polymerase alpha subunit